MLSSAMMKLLRFLKTVLWGGSSAVSGMTANPLGARRVGTHTADRLAGRCASGHDDFGACRCEQQFSVHTGTPFRDDAWQ